MEMEKKNEEIDEDLIRDLDIGCSKSEVSEHDDNIEFQDALGSPVEDSSHLTSESESDYEDVVNKEETQLSEEDIEERKKQVFVIKEQGNEQFRSGSYSEACQLYSTALKLCPASLKEERSVLYNNRAAAKLKQSQNEGALKDCTKALDLNPVYVKALLRRAKIYEELEQLEKALADYQEVDKLEPSNIEVKSALMTLPKRIEQQNENLKKEMLGKMKDLGNMILRPFGLSTDNFQINQDSTTGSYSINMTK